MTDGLVTALEKDGYPSREACLADSELERVAADCDLLFTTMARFASPEVKREVLRQLLGEQLDELAPDGRIGLPFVVNLTHGFKVFHADACEADPDTAMAKVRAALLDFLAPEAR